MRKGEGLAPFLFWTNMVLAISLALLMVVLPFVIAVDARVRGWQEILVLFGHDQAVRRVGMATSVVLLATAFVCFRPISSTATRKTHRQKIRPVAGA